MFEWQPDKALPTFPGFRLPLHRVMFVMTVLFITTNVNGWVIKLGISFVLTSIIRSCGLLVTMLLGVIMLGRRYTWQQVLCVVALSVGVGMITILSVPEQAQGDGHDPAAADVLGMVHNIKNEMAMTYTEIYEAWKAMDTLSLHNLGIIAEIGGRSSLVCYLFGVALLGVSLFLSALMSIVQEKTYKLYGKWTMENMFVSNVLALFCFWFTWDAVRAGWTALNDGVMVSDVAPPVVDYLSQVVPSTWPLDAVRDVGATIDMPLNWGLLLLGCVCHMVGMIGVFELGARNAVLLGIALCLRRCVTTVQLESMQPSPIFGMWHWISAIVTFGSGMLYGFMPKAPSKDEGVDATQGATTKSTVQHQGHLTGSALLVECANNSNLAQNVHDSDVADDEVECVMADDDISTEPSE